MSGELPKPGIEIVQTIRKASPSIVRPTLAPCVVGPAFEVLNVLNTDGTINSKALFGSYAQMAKSITESAFPDPRGNLDELDVLEASVRPYLLYGGTLKELVRSPGQGFLSALHVAQKPAFRTSAFGGGGLDLKGRILVFSLDQVLPSDKSSDITVTFVGTGPGNTGNLKAADAVSQINAVVGQNVASVVEGTTVVQIASPTYGALASVTVRAGGSANATLGLALATDERVEGSGLRAQDPKNNTTQSQWVEFFKGAYLSLVGQTWTAGAFAGSAFLVDVEGNGVSAAHGDVTFAGVSPTVSVSVGDYVYCDGLRLKNGEVMKVEANRFKVGTINTALSVVDDSGQYTSKVYDVQTFGTVYDASPFAPAFVYFVANGLDWRRSAPIAAKYDGSVQGAVATAASVSSAGNIAGPFAITGMVLRLDVTVDGVTTEQTFTFTSGPADLDALVADIGSNIPGVIATKNGFRLVLSTAKTGRLQALSVKGTSTAGLLTAIDIAADTADTGTDIEFAGLASKTLQFKFDKNAHVYTVVFSSNSMEVAIEEINEVVGYTVASHNPGDDRQIRLTSPLGGIASSIEVIANDSAPADAALVLGIDTASATKTSGSGRPFPDAYLDDSNVLHINSQLLRDPVTGYPIDFVGGAGQLYVQYKALRKDVSPAAAVAGVLKISDVDTLSSLLNPITDENPLALGLFLAMINAPTFETKGLGIDEVTAAAPNGTSAAWARAAGMLEAEEVYALAPLTQDETVISLFGTHVGVMSAPEAGGERIVFVNKVMPTRKNSKIAVSGAAANSTSNDNELMLDASPSAGLLAAGVNPGLPFTVEQGVYVEVEVAGELRRYNASSVSGLAIRLNTTFTGSQNTDGFYSTTTLNVPVSNSVYSVKVRGDSLVVPGSNPARLDYATLAETVAEANVGYGNRRLFSVFPDTVKSVISGVEKSLPGYYACAAIAGMVAAQPPQQGFTNFPITGLTGVVGPEKFTKRQLNIMAGGGTYLLVQDVPGGAVYCRHQVSTDLTSIETRELSITKVVDFTAKMLRLGVRKYIGTNNVTTDLLDTLGATVFAIMKFLEATGVLNGFEVNNIAQDKDNPDTVLIDVTLDVPFPCNYIRLTLVV
jgi:hypothetical protein